MKHLLTLPEYKFISSTNRNYVVFEKISERGYRIKTNTASLLSQG